MSENITNKSTGTILSWVFGAMLSFFGFIGFMASAFISGLMLFLMGLILLPPIGKFVETKWNFKLNALKKTTFLIVGFFIFGLSISSSDTAKKNTSQVVEQKTNTEVEQEQNSTELVVQSGAIGTEQSDDVQKKRYPVKKVVDGDTVAFDIDGKEEVLRLIGINTLETVDPRKPVQCFGVEASNKAKETLNGKNVVLESDETQTDRDKYGRLLRYIYLEDGTNFNKMMIEEGYAYEYTYETPYKYQAGFKTAQQKSKDEKKGLWAEDTCNGELTKSTNDVSAQTTSASAKNETPVQNSDSSSGTCAGKHLCGQMTSCKEAYFYLNTCGVSSLDRDKDGIPCETICN